MKRNPFKIKAGFSLIEVNMAIFVLAGGALALLGLFPLGLQESMKSRTEMKQATFAAYFIASAQAAATEYGDVARIGDINYESGAAGLKITGESGNAEFGTEPNIIWYRSWIEYDSNIPPDLPYENTNNKRLATVTVKVTTDDLSKSYADPNGSFRMAQAYTTKVLVQ